MDQFAITMRGHTSLTALEKGTITGLLLAGCFVGALFAGKTDLTIKWTEALNRTRLCIMQVNSRKSSAVSVLLSSAVSSSSSALLSRPVLSAMP